MQSEIKREWGGKPVKITSGYIGNPLRQLIMAHRPIEPYVGYLLTECVCGEYAGPDYEGHLASVIEQWHSAELHKALERQWNTQMPWKRVTNQNFVPADAEQ